MLQFNSFDAVSFAANQKLMNRRKQIILKSVIIVIFFNAAVSGVSAQDSTRLLNLTEAITATLNNNKGIQLAKLDESIAASN